MDKNMDENKSLINTKMNNKVHDKGADIELDSSKSTNRIDLRNPTQADLDDLFIPAMPEDEFPSFKPPSLTSSQTGEDNFSSLEQGHTILGIGAAVGLPSLPTQNSRPLTQQDERPAFKSVQSQQDERPAFK